MLASEFADEYGDWLEGAPSTTRRPGWLDRTLGEMTHAAPLCVGPRTVIEEVIELMNQHHVSAALVVERAESEKLLGIFTERDVLTRVVPRIDGMFTRVSEMMTRDPETFSESTPLPVALRTLALGNYHHLPIVDNVGRAKALVSLQTIVAYLAETFARDILNAPPVRDSYPPVIEGP